MLHSLVPQRSLKMEYLLLILLVVVGLGAYAISAFFSGWRDLQRFYPDRESVDDQRVPWYSVNLGRSAYYSGVIHLDMSQRGLRLSITPLLRLYHPPIFIPGSEVTECALAPFPLFGPVRFYCGRAGSLTEKRADANVVKLRVSQWPLPIHLYSFFGKHKHVSMLIVRYWKEASGT